MAKLLVLGASGLTGRHVVEQALAQGHMVTAFVRDPARLTAASEHLRVVTGSAAEGPALASAVSAQDAVICTLGAGKSFKSQGLIATSMPRIVNAMKEAGVRRLIHTSGFGVGETFRDIPLLPRIFVRTLLRDVYRDKAAGEVAVRGSGLDWTIVYPSALTDGPATGLYRVGERLDLRGFPTIARADVAAFLLGQVADGSNVGKGVLITS